MRKNILITGIVLFVIGLIMWMIGGNYYSNAYRDAQFAEMFGSSSNYEVAVVFWGIFLFIGFILFIVGIIVSIVGALIREKNIPFSQHPQPNVYYQQPMQQPLRYCPNCGRSISMDAQLCPYCGNNFKTLNKSISKEKHNFCSECGAKIPTNAMFCSECGEKID